MYLVQQTVTVRYGKFREYHSAMQRLNEIARDRGWIEANLLVPIAGPDNQYMMQFEYPSLADYELGDASFYSDVEAMSVFRSAADFVIEGTSRTDLFQSAPTIA